MTDVATRVRRLTRAVVWGAVVTAAVGTIAFLVRVNFDPLTRADADAIIVCHRLHPLARDLPGRGPAVAGRDPALDPLHPGGAALRLDLAPLHLHHSRPVGRGHHGGGLGVVGGHQDRRATGSPRGGRAHPHLVGLLLPVRSHDQRRHRHHGRHPPAVAAADHGVAPVRGRPGDAVRRHDLPGPGLRRRPLPLRRVRRRAARVRAGHGVVRGLRGLDARRGGPDPDLPDLRPPTDR